MKFLVIVHYDDFPWFRVHLFLSTHLSDRRLEQSLCFVPAHQAHFRALPRLRRVLISPFAPFHKCLLLLTLTETELSDCVL
jgi:hypothetical protein